MVDRCPHCNQPIPLPTIRFGDLNWLRDMAARDQLRPDPAPEPEPEPRDDVNY